MTDAPKPAIPSDILQLIGSMQATAKALDTGRNARTADLLRLAAQVLEDVTREMMTARDTAERKAALLADISGKHAAVSHNLRAQLDLSAELSDQLLKAGRNLEFSRATLRRIAEWQLPATNLHHPSGQPVAYETQWGSNGARDFIRGMAQTAYLATEPEL